MSAAAPTPAEPAARVSLATAASRSDTAAASVLDRILTPGDKQRVEVAAFQSSL